jgi:hypothetical protein
MEERVEVKLGLGKVSDKQKKNLALALYQQSVSPFWTTFRTKIKIF